MQSCFLFWPNILSYSLIYRLLSLNNFYSYHSGVQNNTIQGQQGLRRSGKWGTFPNYQLVKFVSSKIWAPVIHSAWWIGHWWTQPPCWGCAFRKKHWQHLLHNESGEGRKCITPICASWRELLLSRKANKNSLHWGIYCSFPPKKETQEPPLQHCEPRWQFRHAACQINLWLCVIGASLFL